MSKRATRGAIVMAVIASGVGLAATQQPNDEAARTSCHARGALPDRRCTPGATIASATPGVFCVRGYSSTVRNVTESVKRRVYARYGITTHTAGEYEVDHLVPLEFGGSNAVTNLWPELAAPTPGFHEKDRLENREHARACAGAKDWRTIQRRIARDWVALSKGRP